MADCQGYWSEGLTTLLLVRIEHWANEQAFVRWSDEEKVHRCKVNYSRSGRAYIRLNGNRYYFDECMRDGIVFLNPEGGM